MDGKGVELEDFRLIARLHVPCESAGEEIDTVTSRILNRKVINTLQTAAILP